MFITTKSEADDSVSPVKYSIDVLNTSAIALIMCMDGFLSPDSYLRYVG